jgi:hypothetical protein
MKRKCSMLCALCLVLALVLLACQTSVQKPEETSVTTERERITVSAQNTTYDDSEDGFVPIVEKLTDFESDLDSWLGKYEFEEYVTPASPDEHAFGGAYEVVIYKEAHEYFSTIKADGWTMGRRWITKIQGTRTQIDFIFERYWENFETPDFSSLGTGTLVMRFGKENNKLLTWWGWHMVPQLSKSYPQGKEYFIKIE